MTAQNMHLLIDPREGSKRFFEEFEGECESYTLEGGDFGFFGNGPDGDYFIGMEHKKVDDLVKCIHNGRLTGEELPKMLKLFDVCYLIVEGGYIPDWKEMFQGKPRLTIPFRGNNGLRFGMNYQAFDNFQTTIALFTALYGKPCIVKRAKDKRESVEIIRDAWEYWQKPWEDHKSIVQPNWTKMQTVSYDLQYIENQKVEPGDPDYPKVSLRKQLFQIKGIGWEVAGTLADHFLTMETAMSASQRDFESIERVGKGLAYRIYDTLHGHPDPEYPKKKRKEAV